MRVYVHVYVHICVYIHVYVCMYMYVHTYSLVYHYTSLVIKTQAFILVQ